MSELKKISVCQSTTCQNKGSKAVMHRLEKQYAERFVDEYPDLQIVSGDCMGDCEQGPILKINDSMLLRSVDKEMAQKLLEDPGEVLGEVMHVLDNDRDTFDRILKGELY